MNCSLFIFIEDTMCAMNVCSMSDFLNKYLAEYELKGTRSTFDFCKNFFGKNYASGLVLGREDTQPFPLRTSRSSLLGKTDKRTAGYNAV